jgi:hypothetical protein
LSSARDFPPLATLGAFDRGVGGGGEIGVRQLDPGRQLDVEVVGGVDPGTQPVRSRVEDVAAASAVVADEVEVVAGDLDPLDVGRETEAEHRAGHVPQLEDVLVGDDLGQRPVGRALGRHRAGADEVEVPVETDGAGSCSLRNESVEPRQQLLMAELPLKLLVDLRLELSNDRERRLRLGGDPADVAIDVGAEELAVEGDHLAVEPVQCSQPEVAVLGQFGEAEVTVEGTVEQGADRRGLEENVRVALFVQLGAAHRLDVEGPDPALVQHRASLARSRYRH